MRGGSCDKADRVEGTSSADLVFLISLTRPGSALDYRAPIQAPGTRQSLRTQPLLMLLEDKHVLLSPAALIGPEPSHKGQSTFTDGIT